MPKLNLLDIEVILCIRQIFNRVIGMRKIIIYGEGAYGKIFFYEAERYGTIDIEAFTVDAAYMRNEKECGLPVVPFEQVENIYSPKQYDMLVLCGYTVMRNRKRMYERAKEKGYRLINYISPHAMLETEIKMGDNNIIMSNAVVGFDGVMGNGNIIWPNVVLPHHNKIGNFNNLSPSVSFSGYSEVGNQCFIGNNASFNNHIKIHDMALVGAGVFVTKDLDREKVLVSERSYILEGRKSYEFK